MSCEEDQEDEREALRAIYESDENFIEINRTTFQYKFGDDGHYKSFLLEISWPHDYPTCLPDINLDTFYNKHVNCEVKENITSRIKEQCELCLGSAMTYSIFDWTKEHEEELMTEQKEHVSGEGWGALWKTQILLHCSSNNNVIICCIYFFKMRPPSLEAGSSKK